MNHLLQQLYFFALQNIQPGGLPKPAANDASFQQVLMIVLNIVGALAVLMIVISGFRYVLSGGDPQKASSAKTGVVNALVGLAIVAAAQAIVIFVVRRV